MIDTITDNSIMQKVGVTPLPSVSFLQYYDKGTRGDLMRKGEASAISRKEMLSSDFRKNKLIYFMAIPVLVYYLVFHYAPMYGALIAFQNFSPGKGMFGSQWVGFKYFIEFFQGYSFWTILRNTVLINLFELIWGFPAPIIFALLLNEIRSKVFKRTVQTVTYLPHFISIIVICGLVKDFTSTEGLVNDIIAFFGGERSNLLTRPEMFRTIFVSSGIWQNIGWGSIIYLSALTGIDPELYDASKIDGAGRFGQILHITLPGIAPTIIILLILRIGNMLNLGFEKIILLYNPLTYETSDVISSFVYRKGLIESSYSFAAAVGLFNSVINFSLLVFSNQMSKRFSETKLW